MRDAACGQFGKYVCHAKRVLAHDFLSPTLASLVYRDLPRTLLPFSIPAADRAAALERAWEEAFRGGEDRVSVGHASLPGACGMLNVATMRSTNGAA